MISLTHFQTVLVDVFDDQLADYDERHGQKHPGSAEQFSAEDDAENDRDRMQIQRLADQCGINQIMVDLSQHEIEASGLQGDKRIFRSRQQRAEGRGDGWSENRNEFAGPRHHGKYGSIRKTAQGKIQEDNDGRDAADDKLAADIRSQGGQNPIEQFHDALVIMRRKAAGQIGFDEFAVFQQIKSHKEDNDNIDEFAEHRQEQRQGRFQRIDADGFEFLPEIIQFVIEKLRILQERQGLQLFRNLWEICDKAGESRNKRAGYNR